MGIFKLITSAVLPIVATYIFYFMEKNKKLSEVPYLQKQIIIGTVFGFFSVLGSEMGIHINNAIVNTRDVAPICAGLIFGAPAGLIAGVIGGTERWISVLWNGSYYTRLACTIATLFSGLFAGMLRKVLFDDKKPSWYYGFIITCITEVFHMLLIFITNTSDIRTAFDVVRACSLPMILINGLAVAAALWVVSLILNVKKNKYAVKQLAQSFQRWLLFCVAIAFLITSGFSYFLQTKISYEDAGKITSLYIDDVTLAIKEASDESMLKVTKDIVSEIEKKENPNLGELCDLSMKYKVSEINLIDNNGIIYLSTNYNYIGYNIERGEQSAEFECLLDGQDEFVQNYRTVSQNDEVSMKYAGVARKSGGFVQVGYDGKKFHENLAEQVEGITHNRHVGENGYILISDSESRILSDPNGNEGEILNPHSFNLQVVNKTDSIGPDTLMRGNIYGKDCFCVYAMTEGFYILSVVPVEETLLFRDLSVYIMTFMQIIVSVSLFLIIYMLIKNLIVKNIHKINNALAEITGGNLNVSVNVRNNEEFACLSDDINQTVDTLKTYIEEAASRIDKELEFAKTIQFSSLPGVFPEREEYDIYAEMHTAKEVGGDFYDFYQLDKHHLAFLIADVSGKGISAAMFMMKAKTLIKSYAEQNLQVEEILTHANEELCNNNEAGMFVTCWMGIIDLRTYLVRFANAGHNPPLVKHENGSYEYFKTRPGFVLGGMEGIRYKQGTLQLKPGDAIFLYTDGVTEATNAEEKLFGEDRLSDIMHNIKDETSKEICALIKNGIDNFVGEAPQFDDITMMSLKLKPKNVIKLASGKETVAKATEFVEETLSKAEVSNKIIVKMNIATDEICSNIVFYSGADEIFVECEADKDKVILRFADNGVPYNALKQPDADITLPADERKQGGLGIFMVKKLMDNVSYEYYNEMNILTLEKKIAVQE